ncbi:ATP-binding cassette domain-containing protein [Spiroplasma culicicola]|uniref:ABC transporter ATP-binding protein n=1 Tax=Spiroplasma culicicola AES-1 TaxID=1276246 RepID=W6A6I3_9MOLU|nr:ABC transporter ATP-binding protein [Spiroplasma culicicola]AHI52612.1 ABC transporter ATP-binding protein [Spiroplasma culicicola AES-1]
MITIKDLNKNFGKKEVLKNINLKIEKQDHIALIGYNGSGKTTLIKLILDLLTTKKGKIEINNLNIKDNKFNLKNICYISNENDLPENMRVVTYVDYILKLTLGRENKLTELSELFNFDIYSSTLIRDLSTGMRQKLKICTSLCFEQDLYIFDEITSGLDPVSKTKLINYINTELITKTVIYCSHILEEIVEVCSKAIILNQKQISDVITINDKDKFINQYNQSFDIGDLNHE